MNNAQATQIEDGVRELHARIAELTAQRDALANIGKKLLAIFNHPTASVTVLEVNELCAALAAVGEKK